MTTRCRISYIFNVSANSEHLTGCNSTYLRKRGENAPPPPLPAHTFPLRLDKLTDFKMSAKKVTLSGLKCTFNEIKKNPLYLLKERSSWPSDKTSAGQEIALLLSILRVHFHFIYASIPWNPTKILYLILSYLYRTESQPKLSWPHLDMRIYHNIENSLFCRSWPK